MTPAQRLAALADHELMLLTDGRLDELAALGDAREAALALLASTPPGPHDRAALIHAAETQALAGAALRDGLARTGAELARLGRSRTAAQGYLAATGT